MIWTLLLTLLVPTALLFWWSARRRPQAEPEQQQNETVRQVYQQRQQELQQDRAQGRISQAELDDLQAELDANLLEDFRGAQTASGQSSRAGWVLAATLAVVAVAAVAIYPLIGEPDAEQLVLAQDVLALNPRDETQRVTLVERSELLLARGLSHPKDAKSAYLLGHALLKLEQYPRAAETFARAQAEFPDDPNIKAYWLQARYLADQGVLDQKSRELAAEILSVTPNHTLVLELMGVDAYRQGRFGESVTLFNRAIAGVRDLRQQTTLIGMLKQARKALGDRLPAIDVSVDASDAPPHGTVFVIARPLGGGVPFAVVRRPALMLPFTVRLDDPVSMNPALPLSQASDLEVVVRLSQSGRPMAAPGDWEWTSDPLGVSDLEQPLALQAQLAPPDAKIAAHRP